MCLLCIVQINVNNLNIKAMAVTIIHFETNTELELWLNEYDSHEIIQNGNGFCILKVDGIGLVKCIIEDIFS